MSKMTRWFPGKVKPVRKGVYQQRSGGGHSIGYQLWDGRMWRAWTEDADSAERQLCYACHSSQNDPWRGLASDPSKGKK